MKRIGVLILVVYLLGMGTTVSHAQGGAITFAAGATSATLVNQYVAAGSVSQYTLRAMAGQVMTVQITSVSPTLALTIYGASDGVPFVRSDFGLSVWTGTLTINQVYVIQVVNRGGAANFNLFVSIPARVNFNRGATGTTLVGRAGGDQTVEYLLGAAQGQTLSVAVYADTPSLFLSIYGADGTMYLQSIQYQTAWTMQLPKTQDYIVQVINTVNTAIPYTLQVQIPSRVQFARGAVSTRIQGYIEQNGRNEYVLGARGGQTMTVTITSPYTTVGLTIWGDDGQPLKRYEIAPTNAWSGQLPATQDYHIAATALGGATSYVLDITIVN
ncbi:MAG: hypothetical protein KF716_13650 [Anaerolineae bacterium]|nr:hypothetical protein [Anaerolineae bacterium]